MNNRQIQVYVAPYAQNFTVETLGGAILIVWGFFVANPYIDTFNPNNPVFSPMRSIAPEFVWGVFYGGAGCISLYYAISKRQKAAALVNVLFLNSISTLFLIGDYRAYGWAIYFTIAFFNFIHWYFWEWKH